MMETDPDKINDADRQIEATIFKQGQDYAERNKRSKVENKGRAESREKIKAIGMDPNAYATAIRLIKDKTPRELADWKRDFELTLKVMGSRQKELFPEEQLKAEARIQRAQEKAAGKPRDKAELDAKTDTDPKSDPNAGGAQIDIEEAIANAKSDAWREGFSAFGAGVSRSSIVLGSGAGAEAEYADWIIGWDAASDEAFNAAKPKEPDIGPGTYHSEAKGQGETLEQREAVEGEAALAEAAPSLAKKPSQSEKAKAKRDAAGMH